MSRLLHPNIVRVYGGCMTPPNLFVVSELLMEDLSSLIHKPEPGAPPMSLSRALGIALDVIQGLVRESLC